MKSNTYLKKLTNAFVMMTVMAASPLAFASNSNNKDETPLSAIGIERGLELYDKDKSDTCVPGALQIRVTVHNVSVGGILKLELFGENNFLKKEGKLRRIRVPAETKFSETGFVVPMEGVDIDIHLVDL